MKYYFKSKQKLTVSLENWEWRGTTLLDELGTSSGRERGSLLDGRDGDGDSLRAVNEFFGVVAGDRELSHSL